MAKSKELIKEIKRLSDLVTDFRNANKGSQRGGGLLENSLQKYGAGRSVLVDKSGKIIAGNKTTEAAHSVGLDDDVLLVKSDGKRLVVVQRTDLDINSKEARELAIADNRIGEINLDWDVEILASLVDEGVEIGDMFSDIELSALTDLAEVNDVDSEYIGLPDFEAVDTFKIIINFETAEEQEEYAKQNEMKFTGKAGKTWSTWYPERDRQDLKAVKYE